MAVRLIALDIDGTLLDSRWQLPEANRLAVAEAARRGIEVALVTGRRYDFAMPVARELDAPITMIVNNGALVRSHDGTTHLRYVLRAETARNVLRLTEPWRDGANCSATDAALARWRGADFRSFVRKTGDARGARSERHAALRLLRA